MHKLIVGIFKFVGSSLLIFFLLVIFITPVRDFMNNLFYKDKKIELNEEQIIGVVFRYNPNVEEIQKILKGAGFDSGPIDGIMGNQTRAAIRKFQKEKGLKPTGKIDSTTQIALNREKEITKQTLEKESDLSLSLDPVTHTDLKSEDSEIEVGSQKNKDRIQNEIMSYRLKTKDRVAQIQVALEKAGFYKGKIDGKLGPQTRRAIVTFQKSKGLKADGIVGPKTWEELNRYLKDEKGR